MWISFNTPKMKESLNFAIKVFLGGVNGISGEPLIGDMNSILSLMQPNPVDQDYIIIPGQIWLDGIATEPGVVRQFVATTMCPRPARNQPAETSPASLVDSPPASTISFIPPSGSSIEYQTTGSDTVGGIQLQIIPELDINKMSFSQLPNVYSRTDTPTRGRRVAVAELRHLAGLPGGVGD
jgi:hypothetical protein